MPPALLQDSDTQLLRERAETILWIKTQMARYGLHLADLQNAGSFSEGASLANAVSESPAPSVPFSRVAPK
ncbi:hypothetical protein D9M68_594570 [compost metagenome]